LAPVVASFSPRDPNIVELENTLAHVVASFSSRGPNIATPNILKVCFFLINKLNASISC
jgi:hypothetical protein